MIEIEWDDDLFLDCYDAIRESDADVKLYWGGRDSGKSYHIALELIEKCLSAPKFKCILVRKTFNSIRESQYELLKSIIEDLGLEQFFVFHVNPLEIICMNGNKFIARGCDKPENVKSITNPTDAWYEEADKITLNEFSVISTTLRSEDVKVQERISFNPESDGNYEEHWLYKLVEENYNGTYEWANTIKLKNGDLVEVNYIACHTTFDDNPYCPDFRKAKYMATTEDDDYLHNVFIYGRWGNQKIKRPFCTHYNEKTHVVKEKFNPNRQTYCLIDFNYEPFCASIFQMWFDGEPIHRQVDEIAISSGTTNEMAQEIKLILGDALYITYFGGDYNGDQNRIGKYDNLSLYKELQKELGISWSQFKLKPNPPHKISRKDCNYFLKHANFGMDEMCTDSRRDMRTVQVDAFGGIIKKNRKDESQKADHIDNFRYYVNTFCKDQIEHHKKFGSWV